LEEAKDDSGPETSPSKKFRLDKAQIKESKPKEVTRVKGVTKHKEVVSSENLLLWKSKLEGEIKRVTLRFQGTRSAYLVNTLEQICASFLEELSTLSEQDISSPVILSTKKSKSKSRIPKAITAPNPNNLELTQKERALKQLAERLTAEDKEWEELKKQFSVQPPKKRISVSVEATPQKEAVPKITPTKSLETLSLQVDELKPILKEMKHFNTIAEKFCSDTSTTLTTKGFSSYGKADPKELIRSLAYAEDL